MKALQVEFAPPRRLPAWMWYFASVLMLAVAAHQGWQAWGLFQQAKATEAEVVALRAKIEQARQAQREALERQRVEPPYAKDAAEIAKVAEFPVERIFAAIESAQVPGVKVAALEMAAAEGTAHLDVEFSEHGALLRYLEAINAGEDRARWMLIQAQLGTAGLANTASISSQWAVKGGE